MVILHGRPYRCRLPSRAVGHGGGGGSIGDEEAWGLGQHWGVGQHGGVGPDSMEAGNGVGEA